jgi:hypothetical protein
MAENKTGAMLSGVFATLAATLPLETSAQSYSTTIFGWVNTTAEAIDSSPAFGVRETATGNVPVTQGDSHVRGHGWTVRAEGLNESRLGFRGVEDLGGGLRAGFFLEASGSTTDTTSRAVVAPNTDRTRIFYLTPSPFGTKPTSIGLGFTGLDSTVETRVRNYQGKADYAWPSFPLSDRWNVWGRPSLGFRDFRTKIDYNATAFSPTFGNNLRSITTVGMRDAYYGIGGGLDVEWRPGFGPNDRMQVGQATPSFLLSGNVAALWRDSSRHANQFNLCAVAPCGAGESFATAVHSFDKGYTWSASVRGEFRLNYRANPTTNFFATAAGGWNIVGDVSRFNMPESTSSGPAHFDFGTGRQRYFGGGLGVSAAF